MKDKYRPFDPVTSDWFWPLVEKARQDPEKMREFLEKLPQNQLKEFFGNFEEAMRELVFDPTNFEKEWGEDGVAKAQAWVVAHGKEHYLAVWNNPNLLPNPDTVKYLIFSQIAADIHSQKYGEWLY
jgi:hypothetical protein